MFFPTVYAGTILFVFEMFLRLVNDNDYRCNEESKTLKKT